MRTLIFTLMLMAVNCFAAPQPGVWLNPFTTNRPPMMVRGTNNIGITNIIPGGNGTSWTFYGISPNTVARLTDLTNTGNGLFVKIFNGVSDSQKATNLFSLDTLTGSTLDGANTFGFTSTGLDISSDDSIGGTSSIALQGLEVLNADTNNHRLYIGNGGSPSTGYTNLQIGLASPLIWDDGIGGFPGAVKTLTWGKASAYWSNIFGLNFYGTNFHPQMATASKLAALDANTNLTNSVYSDADIAALQLRTNSLGLSSRLLMNNGGQISNVIGAASIPNGALLGPAFRESFFYHTNFTNAAEISLNQNNDGSIVAHWTRINAQGILWRSTNADFWMTNWSQPVPVLSNCFFPYVSKLSDAWYLMCRTNYSSGGTSNIFLFSSSDGGVGWAIANSGNAVFTKDTGFYAQPLNPAFCVATNGIAYFALECYTNSSPTKTSIFAATNTWSLKDSGTLSFTAPTIPTFGGPYSLTQDGFYLNPYLIFEPQHNAVLLFASEFDTLHGSFAAVSVAKYSSGDPTLNASWTIGTNTWEMRAVTDNQYGATDPTFLWGITNKAFTATAFTLFAQSTGVQWFANCNLPDFYDNAFQTNSTRVIGSFETLNGDVNVRSGTLYATAPTFWTGGDVGAMDVKAKNNSQQAIIKLTGKNGSTLETWQFASRGNIDAPNNRLSFFDPNINEVITFLNGGNIGLNIKQPSALLQVSNSSAQVAIRLEELSTRTNDLFQAYFANTLEFNLTTNGSAFFNGNVGIGTTTPAAKLDVQGNVKVTGGETNKGTTTFPTNNAAHTTIASSGLHTVALGKGWTNDLGARADLILSVKLVDAVTGDPAIAFTNTVTGEAWTNNIIFGAVASVQYTITIPDLSPSDYGSFTDLSGAGASVTILNSWWKLK